MAAHKEPRRSNRRSAHSSATEKSSGSPSPDAASAAAASGTSPQDIPSTAPPQRTPAPRSKRPKDDPHDDMPVPSSSGHRRTTSVASTHTAANNHASSSKRSKRKKDPAPPIDDLPEPAPADLPDTELPIAEEEILEDDAGVTRCVCEGQFDDDGDAPEFMVQCEMCMVWQHGPCVGFAQESELPPGDYYCEQCKPENHVELLKRLQRRQRQNSEKSGRNSHAARESRSHSPTHFLKTTKRRNTMNSRDAAYEQSIQELLEATAAEGATVNGDATNGKDRAESVAKTEDVFEEVVEIGPGGRKKRKRTEDETTTLKRKRSTSIVSERVLATTSITTDKVELASPVSTTILPPPLPPPTNNKSRSRRNNNRKNAIVQDPSVAGDGEDVSTPARKHPNQYTYRAKSGTNNQSRRAPQSGGGQKEGGTATHDHGTRRNANSGNSGASGASGRNHNAYYNNLQLPMFTSWGLPDYLAHLQSILPSDVPPPLQIRGATSFFRDDTRLVSNTQDENAVANGMNGVAEDGEAQAAQASEDLAGATESLTERGVKVKWPAKRMSVSDMNKRVRALVEWVGREQALALDRERRKAALEEALAKEQSAANPEADNRESIVVETKTAVADAAVADGAVPPSSKGKAVNGVNASAGSAEDKMALDGVVESGTSTKQTTTAAAQAQAQEGPTVVTTTNGHGHGPSLASSSSSSAVTTSTSTTTTTPITQNRVSTTKVMEELMEELISFQERFGPGAKNVARERERHVRIPIYS